jgi:hypothetical protein
MKTIWIYASVTAGLMSGVLLTSCGADTAPSTDPAYYTTGGYWTGSLNGEPGVGLADENGNFTFIAVDGEQYPSTLVIVAPNFPGDQPSMPYSASLAGSMQGFTPGGFPNYGVPQVDVVSGKTNGTGLVNGIIVPRQSIDSVTTFSTSVTIALSLNFSALYYLPSSLATISGTYRDLATGAVFTIGANGTVFAQDAATGCVINGTVSITNKAYNVYGIEVSYANCTGSLTTLNGVTLAGMAALDNSESPEQLLAGVWSSGSLLSVTYKLVRL